MLKGECTEDNSFIALRDFIGTRAGARAVDLGGPNVCQGGQSLKLSTKATVFKRVRLLIGGRSMPSVKHGQAPLPPPPLGAGPGSNNTFVTQPACNNENGELKFVHVRLLTTQLLHSTLLRAD